ncbi:unnamed protein product [Arctogadus glacialis]
MAYTWECLDVLRRTGRQHPLLAPDHRRDIVAVTPWLAPIVWERTFDPRLMDSIYKPQNLTISATVFAVGKAFIAHGEGDFYYCGGAFGGSLKGVHSLASTCRDNSQADAALGLEATWTQAQADLQGLMSDGALLPIPTSLPRPTKVLSPEYLWQDFKLRKPELRIIRFSGVKKNYSEIRPNV